MSSSTRPSESDVVATEKALADDACGADSSGCCSPSISRRQLLQLSGAGAAMTALGTSLPVMAGPFESTNAYLATIPIDKKLDPAWVKSLFERGEKETVSDPHALRHIGMPVGGLFAGTVYLGGDGRLWLWDIFNRDQEGIEPRKAQPFTGIGNAPNTRSGLNYLQPAPVVQPFQQGFSLRVAGEDRSLDLDGFATVRFDGRYPIGRVTYQDAKCPIEVHLEAFSPFLPLNVDDSSLPATVMRYTLRNSSDAAVDCELSGHIENPVCLDTGSQRAGIRRNRIVRQDGLTAIVCEAGTNPGDKGEPRTDIVFEDFERADYSGWEVQGTAFGAGPARIDEIPDYQGDVAGRGKHVANSHATAPGKDIPEKDSRLGTMTSKPFNVARRYIRLLVGGGAHQGKTCVNLLVDGKQVASVAGHSENRMRAAAFHVDRYEGQQAQLQIVDQEAGPWGNIGVDQIVFSDRAPTSGDLAAQRDFGTMALALVGDDRGVHASASADREAQESESGLADSLVGHITRSVSIGPGEEAVVEFVLAWHFPNFHARGVGNRRVGHHYASRFDSALSVVKYVVRNFERLAGGTRTWVDTWYDSTLPYWLLDRTMANTSILATTTCYRFEDGRFWAWEGIGCCPGTCTHVWHYAQAPGRLFPEIERVERERVNFGIGLHADGAIGMRTDLSRSNNSADDGQCGRILGAYREHQMSADDAFLRRIWPNIKKALQYMIARDGNGDGMVEGAQHNTLDAAWYGKISFLASLYLAALRSGAAMAAEMGDESFAKQCRAIAERGAKSILETYNGEYFVQIADPKHSGHIGIGPGCYIDQVFGQTWAHWVGLGQLFDRDKQLSALRALWKYNFVPDAGAFREKFPRGRWYATSGDAGLLMCTWPKGGQDPNFHKHWQYMYFNECMSGFEWQAAAHMVWEGLDQPDLLQAGLAVSRAIHDRYNAARRNPYNEVECSDHYSRAMASYGVFQAVCGFEYHGPKGHLAYSPRLSAKHFRCALVTAEGWGSYEQHLDGGRRTVTITIKQGRLRLQTLTVDAPPDMAAISVTANINDRPVTASALQHGARATITFPQSITIKVGEQLTVVLS